MKVYRLTKSPFGILLFPTPVDKQNMFLINSPTELHGKIYKHLLDFGALSSPLDSSSMYLKEGLHTDGVTFIYRLNWDEIVLKFLPKRELDLDRARTIEGIIAKKFAALFKNIDKRNELIHDIQFRFSEQKLCSECQKLGIKDSRLQEWFDSLGQWRI